MVQRRMDREDQHRIFNLCLKGMVIFLAYVIIAILSTWPLATHITIHIADHFGDGALHMWNTWWDGQALTGGQNPYSTELLFFPNGVSLVTQNFAWFHILASLLLAPFLNSIASFNVAVLLGVV